MKDSIKILFVEDVLADAEMIWHEITKSGLIFKKKLVDNRKDYIAALKSFEPEFIISDYSMPQFDGMSALTIKNELAPDVPFILVTGSINEEIAVEAMKNGADDYVIKQNLSRLVPAIQSALKKWEIFREKDAAEKALKESEERFRMLFDKAPIGYQSLDFDGNFIEVNETWLEMLGYSRDEVLGKWFGSFLAPDFVEPFRERFPLFKEWGKVHSEFSMLKKDGTFMTVAFDGRIGHTPDGEFKQTHCVLEDVTELRLAEETLRESESRFHLAVANSPVPIMIHDEDDKILLLSNGWTVYSGYTIKDIPTMGDWTEAAYGERTGLKKDYIDNLFNIWKTQDNGEWTITTKDGSKRIWEFHTTPLGRVNKGKRVLHSLAIDITEQKKSEETLKQKIAELEEFNDLTVGRELKMVELKKEVNELLVKLGENEKYKIVE
jgi:PAS domain S-box-containing protein